MPTGNHHVFPSGIWWEDPSNVTLRRLLFRSFRNVAGFGLFLYTFYKYRSMSWNYTYTNFIGKTMAYGDYTRMNHEPLSAEQIDRLKAEEKERKRQKKFYNL